MLLILFIPFFLQDGRRGKEETLVKQIYTFFFSTYLFPNYKNSYKKEL